MSLETIRCNFCAFRCRIAPGKTGRCGIRRNLNNQIITVSYGEVSALAVDPIEKKPLYHFLPGSNALSVALAGCNFTCQFCQNQHISQKEYFYQLNTTKLSPEGLAVKQQETDTPIVAYTYSEPTVWRDYMLDSAKLLKPRNVKNVMITNGFFSKETIQETQKYIDGFNIDLKGDNDFYKTYCGGEVDPVLQSIKTIAANPEKVLEVTTLLIEKRHKMDEIMRLGEFLEKSKVKVWHLSRFYPCYKMIDIPATTEQFLLEVLAKVKSQFDIPHIYAGNSNLEEFNQTICPKCGKLLIKRSGWSIIENNLINGKCTCGHKLYGIFTN